MTLTNLRLRFCLPAGVVLLAALLLVPGCPPRGNCRTRKLPAKKQGDRYDVETKLVMKKVLKSDGNAVDVGSFKGNILALMVKIAPKGTHYAFEPIPKFAAVVRKRFPSPNVKVHEMALGAKKGTAIFQYVTTNPAFSGLKRRGYPTKKEIVTPIKVRVERLDDIIPATTKVNFIKIDVEGGEYGVLQGAIQTIRRNKPVIVFEHGGSATKYGVTNEMMYRMFTETLGLKVNLMSCWLEGQPPLTLQQFKDGYKDGRNWYYMAYP